MIIYGINPVLEALAAGRVREVRVGERSGERLERVLALAREQQVPVRRVTPDVLDRDARRGVHQGVTATVDDAPVVDWRDLLTGPQPPLIVVLDGVEDPHNLGAIIRTVDAAGGNGIVIQSRRSAALAGAAAKAAAGALAHVRVAEVVNIARALGELKEAGVWTIGLAGDAGTAYDGLDMTGPTALVVGAEGQGLRRLVRESCDFLASIPMLGRVGSLNVSVATGIALYEAVRQRRSAGRG